MQVSAELRWFWKGQCPNDVSAWFGGPEWPYAPIMEKRSDEYFLMPGNTEIGCKIRDAAQNGERRCEMKALITRFERNHIELWGKWEWHIPAHAPRLMVHKKRQLRRCYALGSVAGSLGDSPMNEPTSPSDTLATIEDTCRIELCHVCVNGFDQQWWTLGLETWGDLTSAPLTLARGLDHLAPPVSSARLLNYPQFLNELLPAQAASLPAINSE